MAIIYHITSESEWKQAVERGYYEALSLKDEGFIHCSLKEQLPSVLERYFQGQKNLCTLEIETDLLSSPFYYEWSPSVQDTFPHIYGAINLDAVRKVEPI